MKLGAEDHIDYSLASRTLMFDVRNRCWSKEILEFAETVEISDVREVIGRQIEYNMAIAEEGLKNSYGANVGSVLYVQMRMIEMKYE